MSLESAVGAAERLRQSLAREVEAARGERVLLRKLDSQGLFTRAAERAHFLSCTAGLERELAAALSSAAGELGLSQVTLAALERASPRLGGRLADLLGQIRALAGALRELDQLNAALAQRALSCVRGYVEALSPTPRAYDRGGQRADARSLVSISSRA